MLNSMRLNVDTGVIASGASPPHSLSLWQGVICDLGMCVIRAMGWSLGAARLPCVPDPRPISRDRDLAHRPWPGSITFHRCADELEGGTGPALPGSRVLLGKSLPPSEIHFLLYQMRQFHWTLSSPMPQVL